MTELRTEGIILRTLDFQERNQIATLFSPDQGLLKLILKSSRQDKRTLMRLTPLMRVECLFIPGKGELAKSHEASIIDAFPSLRNEFAHLNTGCSLAQAILVSQLPGKPAPLLYELLVHYLVKIPQTPNLEALLASFYLKILKHDGLIGDCADEPHDFSDSEASTIIQLLNCRSFPKLQEVAVSTELRAKIGNYFLRLI